MGEVYRAKDTKLKRDVAIKILPDEFSQDTDRVSRFQRKAESLAALNHQNTLRRTTHPLLRCCKTGIHRRSEIAEGFCIGKMT